MRVKAISAMIRRSGKFLLAKRSPHKRSGAGYWCAIAGKIEAGETEQEAVVREVWEEVGLRAVAVRKLGECDTRDKSARIHWWEARVDEGEPRIMNDENTELGWFSIEEIRKLEPFFEEDLEVFEDFVEGAR
jgi:8-oxo-dGTP diphosphatase